MRAMEYVEEICRFKQRGPGTPAEWAAADYVQGKMEEMGMETRRFVTRIYPRFNVLYSIYALAVAGAALLSAFHPLAALPIGLAGAFFYWGDLSLRFRLPRELLPQVKTPHVEGRLTRPSASRVVYLCGHLDTARSGLIFEPSSAERSARLFKRLLGSAPSVFLPVFACQLGLLALVVMRLFGLNGPAWWVAVVLLALPQVVLSFFLLEFERNPYVEGANDNASALGVALSVAERYSISGLNSLELRVLAVGSEETMMQGMFKLMKKLRRELDRNNTYFIVLDSVGVGELRYVTGEGMIGVRKYRPELTGLCARLAAREKHAGVKPYVIKFGTDAAVPNLFGYPAISLTSLNQDDYAPNYHWPTDTVENLDEKSLLQAEGFVLDMLEELAVSAGPGG
jgi:hypothetical protein